MSDDGFLDLLHDPPSEAFAQSLYARLERRIQRRRNRILAITASIFAGLTLALGALHIPVVRAGVLSALEKIGGIQFMQTSEYPGGGSVTTIPLTLMDLNAAREEFGFSLPEWAPEGYFISDTVQVHVWDDERNSLLFTWSRPAKGAIHLEVTPNEYTLVVGPESVETIEVAGREVALWRGGWNYDEQRWDSSIPAVTLSWSDDGRMAYHLTAMEDAVSVDELIKMVESTP
jgi:hypothetical protein